MCEGDSDGSGVGALVGGVEGSCVGAAVGTCEGALLGGVEGSKLGEIEGEGVGAEGLPGCPWLACETFAAADSAWPRCTVRALCKRTLKPDKELLARGGTEVALTDFGMATLKLAAA